MLEIYTVEELQELSRLEFNDIAHTYGLNLRLPREILIDEILRIQGSEVARVLKGKEDQNNLLIQIRLENQALQRQITSLQLQFDALNKLVTELDDDALRVRLEAHKIISTKEMNTYSRAVLFRLCDGLNISCSPKDKKTSLVKRIYRKMREMKLAERSINELESHKIDQKREAEIELYRAIIGDKA